MLFGVERARSQEKNFTVVNGNYSNTSSQKLLVFKASCIEQKCSFVTLKSISVKNLPGTAITIFDDLTIDTWNDMNLKLQKNDTDFVMLYQTLKEFS